MAATLGSRGRTLWIASLLCSSLLASLFLNLPQLFFEPLYVWARVGVPSLLICGFVGSMLSSKVLRFAGWVGVFCFLVIAVAISVPGEDYVLGTPQNPTTHLEIAGWSVLARVFVATLLSALMSTCLWRLAKT
jgi:hypothetical protein